MANPLVKSPNPDFDGFIAVMKGEKSADRVPLVELAADAEVLAAIKENYIGGKWVPESAGDKEAYYKQFIDVLYRTGYDYVIEGAFRHRWLNHPSMKERIGADTAGDLARENREWANEGTGIIDSWDTLERFPWKEITVDYEVYDILAANIPQGMKVMVASSLFEHVLENLLGYEGLFYLIADDPKLVKEVFDRWGEKVLEYYKSVIDLGQVGGIFHADDLGFKTATMLSPDDLRTYVFPWFKKYVDLAHEHDKPYFYHCCGNVYDNNVIEDLIEDVGIDGFHSFQDNILPIAEAKKRYGDRIALLGGVDVDNLARMAPDTLRAYTREIIDRCMPSRFAVGTGNSVANYIPLENFCIMLEEAHNWSG